jgi:hypothetical protein
VFAGTDRATHMMGMCGDCERNQQLQLVQLGKVQHNGCGSLLSMLVCVVLLVMRLMTHTQGRCRSVNKPQHKPGMNDTVAAAAAACWPHPLEAGTSWCPAASPHPACRKTCTAHALAGKHAQHRHSQDSMHSTGACRTACTAQALAGQHALAGTAQALAGTHGAVDACLK